MAKVITVFFILLSVWYAFAATVSKDGRGDYSSIGEAIAEAPSFSAQQYIIRVLGGHYEENVVVPCEKTNIRLVGDGSQKTKIVGHITISGSLPPMDRSATAVICGPGFVAIDVAFVNTAGTDAGPGVALLNKADNTAFYKCSFEGYQDTLWAASGRQFYRECVIYGTVDFIMGNAAAVFQNCMLYARYRPYVAFTAQSRASPNEPTGFVFQNCCFTLAPEDLHRKSEIIRATLGRPWRAYSRVVIMQSYIDSVIDPRGWEIMYQALPINRLSYIEFQNVGPGSRTDERVKWPGVQVVYDKRKVEGYTVSRFLGGESWIPKTGIPLKRGL